MRARGFGELLPLAFVLGAEIERAGPQSVHGAKHLIPVAGRRAPGIDHIETSGVDRIEISIFGMQLLPEYDLHQIRGLSRSDQIARDDDAAVLEPAMRSCQAAFEPAGNGVAEPPAESKHNIEVVLGIRFERARARDRLEIDLLAETAIRGKLAAKGEVGWIVVEALDLGIEGFRHIDRG